jgi:hypothetical protein|tara:strand:- start:266 stop:436 length:171 start_codon:yes stop_codon:yes gene_type:complete
MENIIIVFGISFVGMILICLAWTVIEYVFIAYQKENKLERNMKEYDNKKKSYEQSR